MRAPYAGKYCRHVSLREIIVLVQWLLNHLFLARLCLGKNFALETSFVATSLAGKLRVLSFWFPVRGNGRKAELTLSSLYSNL